MKQGRDAQAEAFFLQAVALDHDSKAWLLLAQIYDRHNRKVEAVKAYHTLVYSDEQGWGGSISTDPNTHLRYVLALLRNRQWPEAVDVYTKTMQMTLHTDGHALFDRQFDPQLPDFLRLEAVTQLGLGITLQLDGTLNEQDQIKHLKAAVGLEPRWALAQYSYGKALQEAHRYTEAQAAYANAINLDDSEIKTKAQEAARRLKTRQKLSRISTGK